MMLWIGAAGLNPPPGSREQPHVPWGDYRFIGHLFLDQIMKNFKKKAEPEIIIKEDNFPYTLNLYDIHSIGGFKVKYTDNLFDHLYFTKWNGTKFEPTIYIFHKVSFLEELIATGYVHWPALILPHLLCAEYLTANTFRGSQKS